LLGKRVPTSLKVFLLALAIVDDLGAIAVVALVYTESIAGIYLLMAAVCMVAIMALNHFKLSNMFTGLLLGFLTWLFFLKSGVHATIAGVLLALLVPMVIRSETDNTVDNLIHKLHPWVLLAIMPIFAFFNAGVYLMDLSLSEVMASSVTVGIVAALCLGNPIGIVAITYLGDKLGLAQKPSDITWPQIIGVGFLAGIGFTMSLFISSLAFSGQAAAYSKAGILMGSVIAMFLGLGILWFCTKENAVKKTVENPLVKE